MGRWLTKDNRAVHFISTNCVWMVCATRRSISLLFTLGWQDEVANSSFEKAMPGIASPTYASQRTVTRGWAAIGPEWRIVAGFALVTVAIYAITGTRLSLGGAGRSLLFVPLLVAITVIYRHWRPAPLIADCAETTLKLLAILLLGMLISFPAAALGAHFPYRDGLLARADIIVGFDWDSYTGFIAAHPYLKFATYAAYFCMIPQFFLTGLLLAVTAQRARREAFVVMTGFTLAVTLAIFVLMPALSHPGGGWVAPITYMRTNMMHAISFDDLNGIITFPSFHTEAACLFVWACWRIPYVRWPVLALNLALIAATPVQGLHYGVDVLAGAALSSFAIFLFAPRGRTERWSHVPLSVA
jgi:hypothetical protein